MSSATPAVVLSSRVLADLVTFPAWSRRLMLDVEPLADAAPGVALLVLRGMDKVLVGAKPSTAADEKDKAEHKPALVWNDETGAPRCYILATGQGEELQRVADSLMAYFRNSPQPEGDGAAEVAATYYRAQSGGLGDDAALILAALVRSYGFTLKKACKVLTFAEYSADESASAEKRAKREAAEVAKAQAAQAEERARAAEARLAALDAEMAKMRETFAAMTSQQSSSAPAPLVPSSADVDAMLSAVGL